MKNSYNDFFTQAKKASEQPGNTSGSKQRSPAEALAAKRQAAKNAAHRAKHKSSLEAEKNGRGSKQKKETSIAWGWVGASSLGFLLCLGLVFLDESVEQVWSSIKISAFSLSSAQEKSASTTDSKEVKNSPPSETKKDLTSAEIRKWSDEELSFFKELNEKKAQLQARENDILQLEAELQKREVEIDIKLKKLESTRENISKVLKDRVNTDEERIAKLVQFFSNMKPQKAAVVFASLDGELAIHVLNQMKKQDAAAILNFLDPKKAKEITESFAGYREISSEGKNQ